MNKVVESLKRISIAIRTLASVDRYAKARMAKVDHFYATDKSHIEELFEKADPLLRNRLLQAVLSRRRFLQYTKEHAEKLAKETPLQQDEEADKDVLLMEERSEIADTVATPFSPDIFIDDIIAIGRSHCVSDDELASEASESSSLLSDISARVPPMPIMGQEGKPFECPCCFLIIATRDRKNWKRHVFSDMRPYICTFLDCKEPDRLFPSRHDWYSHELAFHRRIWNCISGCSEHFASASAFEAHLGVTHKDMIDSVAAEKYGAHSRQSPEPNFSICPLCGDEIRFPELIRRHIGRHQVQLGLWPLRSMRYFGDMDDEEEEQGSDESRDVDGKEFEVDEDGDITMEAEDNIAQQSAGFPPRAAEGSKTTFGAEDYTIGWICCSPTEFFAAKACLDARHTETITSLDNNIYEFGQVGNHNIIIGCLPSGEYGLVSAASVADTMVRNLPNIKVGLLVGIGGGLPSVNHDIRLGDVVVSIQDSGHDGVVQFDMGKLLVSRDFESMRILDQPPIALCSAVAELRANHLLKGSDLEKDIQSILLKNPRMLKKYSRPDPKSDRLYFSHYEHASNGPCEFVCDHQEEVQRRERDQDEDDPMIHYGLIGSSNQLLKSAPIRDKLASQHNIICFEMEASGIMNNLPCIVIRGIVDYCDSHESRKWQGYGALAAAVYARALLQQLGPAKIQQAPSWTLKY